MSDAAEEAPEGPSIEVLRAWVAGAALHCSLQADAFPNLATWGTVLADVARHVAAAAHEQQGTAPEEALRCIRQAFEEGLAGAPGPEGE
jgi:hypothetical protein